MTTRPDTTEQAVQTLARSLYRKAAEHKPSLFEAKDLLGRMIDWSLEDESLRVALFRFVDVLPSLESSSEIGRHLEEYFSRVDHALGGLAMLAQALHAGTLVAPVVRRNVINLARRFIAEETSGHLVPVLEALRKEPAAFTLDIVGEATVSDLEAQAMQQRYLDLLRRLTKVSAAWQPCAQIDECAVGQNSPGELVGQIIRVVRALRSARSQHRSQRRREAARIVSRSGQSRCGDHRRYGTVRV